MSTADDLRDFYSICEACGRMGHDPVLPEWPTDKQCAVCLPSRFRVASRETAHVLDRWAKRRAEQVKP